ncbi:hypothetical protein Gorai_009237 [Gossypium raimondii]|uniref:DUF4283 domain-containing protein n=1 Tax=Gossypium raimondii TaxID=29730 RepID=A0A7J8PT38_GOSRA|nr:hypothetical protein [Gossypium raimondii]
MEKEMPELNIEDGEDEVLLLPIDSRIQKSMFDHCLVGAPWTFNNHLLIIDRLEDNEDLMQVPLVFSTFWVQVHDLSPGHNDKFCPVRLNKRGEDLEMGWNLNLKLQSRMTITMNSVWLHEEGDDENKKTNRFQHSVRNNLGKGIKRDAGTNIHPILGLNLEVFPNQESLTKVGHSKKLGGWI